MTTQERIKADAEAATEQLNKNEICGPIELMGFRKGYIAGATAVHDRAQALGDALEKAIATMKGCELVYNVPCGNAIILCEQRLKEWKEEKQPDRPCPHCGKELSRDRNLCCRECGKEVEG